MTSSPGDIVGRTLATTCGSVDFSSLPASRCGSVLGRSARLDGTLVEVLTALAACGLLSADFATGSISISGFSREGDTPSGSLRPARRQLSLVTALSRPETRVHFATEPRTLEVGTSRILWPCLRVPRRVSLSGSDAPDRWSSLPACGARTTPASWCSASSSFSNTSSRERSDILHLGELAIDATGNRPQMRCRHRHVPSGLPHTPI